MNTGNQDYDQLQKIFLAALELDRPEEREVYLDAACGSDQQIRNSIEALLKEYEEGGSALQSDDENSVDQIKPANAAFVPGSLIADRYRIVAMLGKGGMGEVYRADDLKLEQPVALKFLPAALAANQSLLKALYNEVRQARRVSHRHVCRVYDIGEADGLHYLSMEYIEGEDLASLLRRIGRLPTAKVIELAQHLCAGLQAAHQEGVLHLDLKPGNLMIDERGDLRVTDFGLARLTSDAQSEKRWAGSPAYMAPEQVLDGTASEFSDIYAVGLLLYEMATGKRAFAGRSFEETRAFHQSGESAKVVIDGTAKMDPDFRDLIISCVASDPPERISSIEAVLAVLSSIDSTSSARSMVPGDMNASPSKPIEGSDVYLTYAAIDDEPLSQGKPGWVSQFHRNLEVRAEQLLGEKISIWRPSKRVGNDAVDDSILQQLPEIKAMVSVVSPPFAHSEGCLREVATFHEGVGGQFRIENHPRLLSAVKTPVDSRELMTRAGAFEGLSGFEFYEKDPVSGRIREFQEAFGEEARQNYYERVYDLAFDLCNILKICGRVGTGPSADGLNSSGLTVYLAATTSDLESHYDSLRRELLEQGHHVLPNAPLPMHQAELERAVGQYLEQSDCIVQIVGPTYGMVPESARHSLLELQNSWFARHVQLNGSRRFIWMPRGMIVEDDRQLAFVNQLREVDASEPSTELLEGTLSAFRDRIVHRLQPVPESEIDSNAREESAAATGSGPPLLYLICDQGDEEAVEDLEDYLFEKGLQVNLPEFATEQEEVSAMHREQLKECDAVMIFYGVARKAWVDIKLRDVIKANGYGREKPIAFQSVYVAPPDDRRKERFKAHGATVVRQAGESFEPNAALDAFIESIMRKEVADA